MKIYTIGEIEDMRKYLESSVKEGFITQETADAFLNAQDWPNIEKLMQKGDLLT